MEQFIKLVYSTSLTISKLKLPAWFGGRRRFEFGTNDGKSIDNTCLYAYRIKKENLCYFVRKKRSRG